VDIQSRLAVLRTSRHRGSTVLSYALKFLAIAIFVVVAAETVSKRFMRAERFLSTRRARRYVIVHIGFAATGALRYVTMARAAVPTR
jgi:hypothetical protein